MTTWKSRTKATGGLATTLSWEELVETYQRDGAAVKAKDRLRAPVFCVVRPECTPETCDHAGQEGKPEVLRRHRCDRAVTAVTAIAFEHDHHAGDPVVPIETAIETLRRIGLAGMVYETPSSTTEGPRWRVVLPITAPWTSGLPGGWKQAYKSIQALLARELGCSLDTATANPSRVFYPPTRPDEDTPPRRVEWIDGSALDVPAALATIPAPAPKPEPEPTVPRGSQGGNTVDRAIALLRTCPVGVPDEGGGTLLVTAAAKLTRGLELSEETAFDLVKVHYNPRCPKPWPDANLRRKVRESCKFEGIPKGCLKNEPHPLLVRLIEEARTGDAAVLFDVSCKLWRQAYAGTLDADDVARELEGVCFGKPDGDSARRTVAKARKVVDPNREPEGCPDLDPPEWLDDGPDYEPDEPGPEPEPDPAPEPGPSRGTRLVDVLPAGVDVDPGLVVPHGFAVGRKLERVDAAKEEGAKPETRTTIARVPLWIGAELVRPEGNLWRVDGLVRGKLRRVVVERSLKHDARRLAQSIEGAGLPVVAGKRAPFDLAEYLDRFDAANALPRKIARAQLGWDPGMTTFLLGTVPIGPAALALNNPTAETLASHFTTKGSAAEWRRTAEDMLRASHVAGLVLAASLASPMLRLFGWAPIGIVLGSLGGGNKSSLLRLGASVWGHHGDGASRQANGIVGNGNATLLALLGQFQALADLPHFVDELRANVTDARGRTELEGGLHQLIDGVERARMKRDGSGPRSILTAPGCAIVATETSASEFLTRGGAVRRFLPVPGPYATRPLGGYVPALADNYGHAGRELIEALVRVPKSDRAALGARREVHLAQLREGTDPKSEALRTWSDQLAVALAAVDVACRLCPAGLPEHDLLTSQILATWESLRDLAGTDGTDAGSDVVTRSYQETIAWIGAMREHLRPSHARGSQLDSMGRPVMVRDPVIGRVFAANDEGEECEVLRFVDVVAPALRDFLSGRGYSIGTLSSEWADRGWLVRSGKRRANSLNTKVGGVQVEVYRLTLPGEGES
jgi:hypothetical protein